MGLDFSKVQQPAAPAAAETEVVQQYDIAADRQQMNELLVDSPQVDELVSQIEVNNLETIVTFGSEAAEEISKCSDVILNSMNIDRKSVV